MPVTGGFILPETNNPPPYVSEELLDEEVELLELLDELIDSYGSTKLGSDDHVIVAELTANPV